MKSNAVGPAPPVVLVVEVAGVVVVLVVEVVGVGLEVLVLDDVAGDELDVVLEVAGGDEVLVLDEVAGDDVLVAPGLQLPGSGLTNSGTATASMQSVLKVVTQSTQSTMAPALAIGLPQLGDAKGVTDGQLDTKPMAAGDTSPLPSQSLSAPPHALQMLATFLLSAFWMRRSVLPVASDGHGIVCWPLRRASQHFCMAFERAPRNLLVDLPIACWHLFTVLPVPNSEVCSAA
jgi:hypothetical protein